MIENNFDTFAKDFLKMLLSPVGEVRKNFELSGDKPQYISVLFKPSTAPESYSELEGYSRKEGRKPEDAFSQDLLENVLTPIGRVQTNVEVPVEPILIDIWFSPGKDPAINPCELGMLSKIAKTECVIVPFEHQVNSEDVLDSMHQLLRLQANFQRLTNQEEKRISDHEFESILPRLWVIAPSIEDDLVDEYGATLDKTWTTGVYSLAPAFLTKIIVINELPQNPETIWLRILGEKEVRKQAIDGVISLPKQNLRRNSVLELLTTWNII